MKKNILYLYKQIHTAIIESICSYNRQATAGFFPFGGMNGFSRIIFVIVSTQLSASSICTLCGILHLIFHPFGIENIPFRCIFLWNGNSSILPAANEDFVQGGVHDVLGRGKDFFQCTCD